MTANQELFEKLRRQRLRMGEDLPPAPQPAPERPQRGDLQSKLSRQRLRMGEEKADARSRIKVKQDIVRPAAKPGRINIGSWEQRCQKPVRTVLREVDVQALGHLPTIEEAEKIKLEPEEDAEQSLEVAQNEEHEAERFYMWDSDEAGSLEESILERLIDIEEPLEFRMLDYLGKVPEAVALKLYSCLKSHEDLVRRLCQRNEMLRAHIRSLRREAAEVRSPTVPAQSPRSPTQVSLRATRERRQLAELHDAREANLRARLQRTIKASRERVQALQRRVQCEELKQTSPRGLEQSIKAAMKEQSMASAWIVELDESINAEALRIKAKEKERDEMLEKQSSLRNDIKALRNSALKYQQRERRIQESINVEASRLKAKEKERAQLLEKQSYLRNDIKALRNSALKSQQRERRIQDVLLGESPVVTVMYSLHLHGNSGSLRPCEHAS